MALSIPFVDDSHLRDMDESGFVCPCITKGIVFASDIHDSPLKRNLNSGIAERIGYPIPPLMMEIN
jgi:hypothetical protein